VLILYVPTAAEMFRVAPPPASQVSMAVVLGVLAVVWRLFLAGRHEQTK